MYRLTEEGHKYLKDGLPEQRLVKMLEKGPVSIKDASRMDDFSIAFQWAKKNNWVKIDRGVIALIEEPINFPFHEALKKIGRGEDVDQALFYMLEKRNLVENVRDDMLTRAKKLVGKEITTLNEDLIKTGLWKDVTLKKYNVTVTGKRVHPGKRQPYNAFLTSVRQKLVELGFIEIEGQTVIQEFWNFDALYQAQNHPSRDWTETYNMAFPAFGRLPDKKLVSAVKKSHENGWKYKWDEKKATRLIPIAHDTAMSPKILCSKNIEIPGKYFQIVRCYRPDVIDATHGVEFNQMGGIIIDKNLNFRHLLGLLKMFANEMAGAEKIRFYSDYYPFTEPSVQISAKHPKLGWIELAGAGIFREELTKPLGIDVPVIAWGFGIDRLAMYKLNIKDIRELFSQNIDWLRKHVI